MDQTTASDNKLSSVCSHTLYNSCRIYQNNLIKYQVSILNLGILKPTWIFAILPRNFTKFGNFCPSLPTALTF